MVRPTERSPTEASAAGPAAEIPRFEPPPRTAGAAPARETEASAGLPPAGGSRSRAREQAAGEARPEAATPPAPQEPAQLARDHAAAVLARTEEYLEKNYDLIGFVGYSTAGKTHALKALVYLLTGIDQDDRRRLHGELSPGPTARNTHLVPDDAQGAPGLRPRIYLDAGGELFQWLQDGPWLRDGDEGDPNLNADCEVFYGLLHALCRAKGLIFTIDLTEEHFRREVQALDADGQPTANRPSKVLEERSLLELVLLFRRAVAHHEGDVKEVIAQCRAHRSVSKALRQYRVSRKLDIPVAVLFTKADRWVDSGRSSVPGEVLAPHLMVGVAPFVRRRLPLLFEVVQQHARRFRFDFMQSCVQVHLPRSAGDPEAEPLWEWEEDPLSVGVLPTIEFLVRNMPPNGRLASLVRWCEIESRGALQIDRFVDRFRALLGQAATWRRAGT